MHDAEPIRGKFFVSYADFEGRFQVRSPAPTDDLCAGRNDGCQAKRFGADGAISTETPYQLWAMARQRHPQQIDGVLYTSRHLIDGCLGRSHQMYVDTEICIINA